MITIRSSRGLLSTRRDRVTKQVISETEISDVSLWTKIKIL